MERETIGLIREAIRSGRLGEPFSPKQTNAVLRIDWAGNFLPKRREDNPGGNTVLFVQVSHRPALYRFK